jgi:serine/threonine protein phosphatase PrpC
MGGSLQHQTEIEFATLSDVGCQRERNEDFSGFWQADGPGELERKGRLAIVADGMGGYEGGQEASQIAVETMCDTFANTPGTPQALLVNGMKAAHERIREYARRHPRLFGMGTTCTAACIVRAHLYFAHIGDSRLYLAQEGRISRLTRDHSYVGRLIESGLIDASDAEAHPQRHILTAALGVGDDPIPDTPLEPLPLDNGNVLLLCTDGLWGLVKDDELRQSITAHAPKDACRQLVDLARKRGAPDNVTLQLLRFNGDGARRNGVTTVGTTDF